MNFEFNITVRIFDFKKIINLLNDFFVTEIVVVDNWVFENQISVPSERIKECLQHIENGKITFVYGKDYRNEDFGLVLHKNNRLYFCDFWFNCDTLIDVDIGFINDNNQVYYERVTRFIFDNFSSMNIYYAVLGCEMLVSDDEIIAQKILKTHGAKLWIVQANKPIDCIINYEHQKFGEYSILWKKY